MPLGWRTCQETGKYRQVWMFRSRTWHACMTTISVARTISRLTGSLRRKTLAVVPGLRRGILENRRFLRRVVRYLAAEAGVSQFLDIGVGLPTQGAVHEVAREANLAARTVYVDYDPVVVSHGQALLTTADQSIMVTADLRAPAALLALPQVRAHLDFTRPVAVLLFAVLHFISGDDDPAGIVAVVRDAIPPGSYLAVSHIGSDFFPGLAAMDRAVSVYQQANEHVFPRSKPEILSFFDGLELVDPGLVPKHEWRPVLGETASQTPNISWGGVARKLRSTAGVSLMGADVCPERKEDLM